MSEAGSGVVGTGDQPAEEPGGRWAGVELSYGSVSDPGSVRTENEDSVLALRAETTGRGAHLFAIADGLGGHLAGDVASRLVTESFERSLAQPVERPERWVRSAFNAANLAVHHHAQDNPEVFNMQSTATLLLIHHNSAVIGHVGDCRAYLVRDGDADLCTTDHSRAMEMLRMRIITPEQAVEHPARNQLTRSLGAELFIQVDIARRELRPGDVFVLCCDGLWSEVSRREIIEAALELPAEAAARRLVGTALEREAADNVSVVVVRVERLHDDAPPPRGRRWLPWR